MAFGKERAVRRCGASQSVRDAARSHGKPPLRSHIQPVGGRRKILPMHEHRLRFSSCPTDCICDLYGSLSMQFGIRLPGVSFSLAERGSVPEAIRRGLR